jgi:colicin import membrane protein
MARVGITFEQVAAAAESLADEGVHPTIKAVRDRLTTGSPNTIHEHLKVWRESKPEKVATPPKLPDSLNAAIAAAIEHAAKNAREEVETMLAQAQAETDIVITYSKNLEAEIEEMKQTIVMVSRKRDIAEGKNEELSKEVERIRNLLDSESKRRITAEQQAAVLAAKLEIMTEKTNKATSTEKTTAPKRTKKLAN